MISLLLAVAVGADPVSPDPVWRCTAAHYGASVSPSGTTAKWPVASGLPEHLRDQRAMLLATSGALPGGRAHVMFLDIGASTVYIEQTAGTPGSEVVFGPLPAVECPPPN